MFFKVKFAPQLFFSVFFTLFPVSVQLARTWLLACMVMWWTQRTEVKAATAPPHLRCSVVASVSLEEGEGCCVGGGGGLGGTSAKTRKEGG